MATSSNLGQELTPAPTDGISSLRIIDNKYLLVSSWDTKVRLYELSNYAIKASYEHLGAVLDCCYSDKDHLFSGGLDKSVKMYETSTQTEIILGSHEKPVRCVEYSTFQEMLITGSWDSTIKLWDPRQKYACIGTFNQPDKVYTISLFEEKLVVGTAGRHVHIYDLRYMDEPQQRRESYLKFQTRCLRTFPNGKGYALSSTEGRVAMEYFDPAPEVQKKKYAFKCHRSTVNGVDTIYPVNTIAFHKGYGTFATGGGDGIVNIWDGENKKRLCQITQYPTSISSLAFSDDGSFLAIASSYTFEEGEKDSPPDQIYIRKIEDHEVRPKMKT